MSVITRKTQIDAAVFDTANAGNEGINKLLEFHINETGELDKLILEYEYGKGKIENVKVLEGSLSSDSNLKGKFKATYQISEYSICAAIDYTDDHTMDIDFAVDKTTNELTLTGETRYERYDEL